MGDDAPTFKISHGKNVSPRKLKRRSGDSTSTPRAFAPVDKKGKDMAASFLQFCAMCEKQIMTPCNSILYCSEACRRKDAAKPLSASNLSLSPTSQLLSPPTSPRPTLPQRSGALSDYQDQVSSRIPFDIHSHKSDLDPTEWKPKIQRGISSNSDAFRYLSRFHQTQQMGNTPTSADGSSEYIKLGRPAALRHQSTLSMSALTPSATTTPSLANTPTTTASSLDSMYEFSLRPLAPRTNPLYSTSAGHSRGIDLVTPHVPPPVVPVEVAVAGSAETAGLDLWGRKVVFPGATPTGKGLGALFGNNTSKID